MTNEVANRPVMQSGLTKINDAYMPQIESQLSGNGLIMTDYQKQCVLSSIQAINTTLITGGKTINDVDQSNMTNMLLTVAALQLNASAVPREIYFQTRNVKRGDDWIPQIEMGIEGDGNDSILSRFGRNVKKVHRFWEVREGDSFSYPGYSGLETTPPTWQPTGQGKVLRIVYPVEMDDGAVEFHIAERADVVRNLIAHINQNLMNETFGIVKGTKKKYGKDVPKTRYDATAAEKEKIDVKKKEFINSIKDKSLEEILDDDSIEKYISPAWKSPQSRESMIIRKMRNNVVKKIPKNFENAYVAMKYQEQDDEIVSSVRKDVTEHTASEPFDFDETVQESDNSEIVSEEPEVQEADYTEIEEVPESEEPAVSEPNEVPADVAPVEENEEAVQEELLPEQVVKAKDKAKKRGF